MREGTAGYLRPEAPVTPGPEFSVHLSFLSREDGHPQTRQTARKGGSVRKWGRGARSSLVRAPEPRGDPAASRPWAGGLADRSAGRRRLGCGLRRPAQTAAPLPPSSSLAARATSCPPPPACRSLSYPLPYLQEIFAIKVRAGPAPTP